MAWTSFRNMLSSSEGGSESHPPASGPVQPASRPAAEPAMPQARSRLNAEAPAQRTAPPDRSHSSLDAIGKRDEKIGRAHV